MPQSYRAQRLRRSDATGSSSGPSPHRRRTRVLPRNLLGRRQRERKDRSAPRGFVELGFMQGRGSTPSFGSPASAVEVGSTIGYGRGVSHMGFLPSRTSGRQAGEYARRQHAAG